MLSLQGEVICEELVFVTFDIAHVYQTMQKHDEYLTCYIEACI